MAKKKVKKSKTQKNAMKKAKSAHKGAGKSRKKAKGKAQLTFTFIIIAGVIFIPTTIVLIAGLLPSFVAVFVDRSRKKTKPITVGAMNLAGCSPFLIELWVQGHTVPKALSVISSPMAIVVMYAAAAVGYLLDWAVTGAVANFMYQRGLDRQKAIAKRQAELMERWGKEVTGDVPLDEEGFSLADQEDKEAPKNEKKKKESRR